MSARRPTRRIERLLLGRHADVTYWFLDGYDPPLLKKAGRSYYEEMTAPVPPGWVLRFDQPVLRAMGAGWILPLVERLARGGRCDLTTVLDARAAAGMTDPPVLDTIELSSG